MGWLNDKITRTFAEMNEDRNPRSGECSCGFSRREFHDRKIAGGGKSLTYTGPSDRDLEKRHRRKQG